MATKHNSPVYSFSQDASGIPQVIYDGNSAVSGPTDKPIRMPAGSTDGSSRVTVQIYSEIPFDLSDLKKPVIDLEQSGLVPLAVEVVSSIAPELRMWLVRDKSWAVWICDPNDSTNTVSVAYDQDFPNAIHLAANSPFSSLPPYNLVTLPNHFFVDRWVVLMVDGQRMNCFDYVQGGLITIRNQPQASAR